MAQRRGTSLTTSTWSSSLMAVKEVDTVNNVSRHIKLFKTY